MSDKQSALRDYYAGIRKAALEEFATTEERLRKLEGLSEKEVEKLIASVHKRHEKLIARIDRRLAKDTDD